MRRWLPGIGRRKPTVPDRELPDDQLRVAWQLVSLLLEYPSVKLFQRLTRLRATAERLPAAVSEPLVEAYVRALREAGAHVETGRFGAHMEVALVNDGPVTILLDSAD